ncbi:MAG: sn-glycerol-3-phosphate ABC transporter ATP-binding protein UgpC [Thermoleophilia bacterium]|nr:sn-glycerol-3-phosphate ABC transporter ATP-binding protein UgpC [Thermoleophilia bacterium]
MAEVRFDEVDKVYENGVQAVFDLTLAADDGEFLVLVGPSGCGKTTALRMVAGLEEISDGTVRIGDRVVNKLSPKERDVAMVFQNYALYPHLSVTDNIAFGLRLRKAPKAEINKRVQWAARLLDLTPYLHRRPKELSGGQRQRVAMGRAIVRNPQVFLMDEPLSNLDAKLRVQMRADISKLQRSLGTTTIYVTHDQVEAMTMGDRVAVMSLGRLQQVDTPQRLYDEPANLFVAGFIGTPPMNLLEATLHSQNGTPSLTVAGDELPLTDRTLARYPGARGPEGRSVVVGVRSDDLHVGSARTDLPTISARLELLEALGSETIAYFHVDARAVRSGAGGIEAAVDEEAGSEGGVTADRPNLVASVPARDALALSVDERMPVAVDTSHVHLFDAETGAPLR